MTLHDFATLVDRTLDHDPGNLLVRLIGFDDYTELAVRPIGGDDPLDHLLGFTAPADWLALGLRCTGRARRLPGSDGVVDPVTAGAASDPAAAPGPVGALVTTLVGRDGDAAGLLRTGSVVTPLTGLPEGMVGDACRRGLGLATSPPPPTTTGLWLRIWLDRLVDVATARDVAHRDPTWDDLASLHPANGLVTVATADGPAGLAAATAHLADAWPWPRLRAEPDVVDSGHDPLDTDLCGWMDDGMFARWLLKDLPPLADLAAAVEHLLPPTVTAMVEQTVRATGPAWPATVARDQAVWRAE